MRTHAVAACLVLLGCPSPDDAVPDPDETDPPEEPGWPWCDLGEAPSVGDEEHAWLLPDAPVWCARFDHRRPLAGEGAAKARLRLGPARVPLRTGEPPALAACLETAPGEPGLVVEAVEPLSLVANAAVWRAEAVATLVGPDGGRARLAVAARAELDEPVVRLDGSLLHPDGARAFDAAACDEPCGDDAIPRTFQACRLDDLGLRRFAIGFEGGTVTLDVRADPGQLVTGPGAVERAVVVLGERELVQEDYWRLWYSPGHHHFSASARVVLDAPVDGVAAVEVRHFDLLGEDPPVEVSLLDADGVELARPAITSERAELVE